MTPPQNPDQRGSNWSQKPFSIEVQHAGKAAIVHLVGTCTMEVAESVGEQLLELASRPAPMLLVELSRLDFIESTGLGGIVSGYLRARKQGGELRLVAPTDSIRHLLELTRLSNLFQVYNRMEDALPDCE